ncbi:MAG: tetratricopeptide repeat protein [ANME-2 cluster archaeon]|nr:MAG: tetratricopeptide repeat protein [ANME-2 cluster archaeon]
MIANKSTLFYPDTLPLAIMLEVSERVLGKEHPDTLGSVNNLAGLLYSKGDYEGAEPLFRRALEASERVLGKDHPDTLTSVNNLAALLDSKGDYKGAEPLYRRALEGLCKVSRNMGGADLQLKTFVNNYAGCLLKMGMNGVQVIQRLEGVLKPYGFSAGDFFTP